MADDKNLDLTSIVTEAFKAVTETVTPKKPGTKKSTASKKTSTAKKTPAKKTTTSKSSTAKKTTSSKSTSSKKSTTGRKSTTAKKTTTSKKTTSSKSTSSKKTTTKKVGKIIFEISGKQIDMETIKKKAAKLGGDVYVGANERKIYDSEGNSVNLF